MAGDDEVLGRLKGKLLEQQAAEPSQEPMPAREREKRRRKLTEILRRLEAGQHVQNRMLKTWLDEESYDSIEDTLRIQNDYRDCVLGPKPKEIQEYEEILKKAIFLENKASGYASRKEWKTALKLRNDSEAEFERLLERLQEILYADPLLEEWFDREIDFGTNTFNLGLTSIQVPRVVTSRSPDNRSSLCTGHQKKRDLKINAVRSALARLDEQEQGA